MLIKNCKISGVSSSDPLYSNVTIIDNMYYRSGSVAQWYSAFF